MKALGPLALIASLPLACSDDSSGSSASSVPASDASAAVVLDGAVRGVSDAAGGALVDSGADALVEVDAGPLGTMLKGSDVCMTSGSDLDCATCSLGGTYTAHLTPKLLTAADCAEQAFPDGASCTFSKKGTALLLTCAGASNVNGTDDCYYSASLGSGTAASCQGEPNLFKKSGTKGVWSNLGKFTVGKGAVELVYGNDIDGKCSYRFYTP